MIKDTRDPPPSLSLSFFLFLAVYSRMINYEQRYRTLRRVVRHESSNFRDGRNAERRGRKKGRSSMLGREETKGGKRGKTSERI